MILKDEEIEIRLFGVGSGLLLKSKHTGITHLGRSLRGSFARYQCTGEFLVTGLERCLGNTRCHITSNATNSSILFLKIVLYPL